MSSLDRQPKRYRGFYNRYQWSKPTSKYIAEDLRTLMRRGLIRLRTRRPVQTVLAYPHLPSKRSSVYRIAKQLNWDVTNLPNRNYQSAIYWEYQTHRQEYQLLERLDGQDGPKVINLYSRDISKKRVDQAFTEAFGYSTFVDPTTYRGCCVEKGDINALHDGRIIETPITQVDPEKIYQRVIDNTTGDDLVCDLRIPIFGNSIPLVFMKYREIKVRFTNSTIKTDLVKPEEVLSDKEIKQILTLCRSIGLEHGELDGLRDNNDQRLYIVDVNNTPQSPPANCPATIRDEAVRLMTASFQKEFLSKG